MPSQSTKAKQKARDARKLATRRLKYETITAYGEVCVCCGEDFLDFLQLDHIYDDGAADRAPGMPRGSRFYRALQKAGWPKGRLNVMCANCNVAKSLNGGRCPCGRAKDMSISSYPKIHHEGHRELLHLFSGPVVVEEKVDGSQISFGVIGGELVARSKSVMLDFDYPDKLFASAIASIRELAMLLRPGAVYRGEFLSRPKHNTLAYDRIPTRHIALYDVEISHQNYLDRNELVAEAERIGLEPVPCYFFGQLAHFGQVGEFMGRQSFLGSQVAEGVVIKNHRRFGADDKPLMAKCVREGFKELNAGEWRANNPTPTDIREALGRLVSTPARFEKAVQHLRDAGVLTDSVRDIGPCIKELQRDIDAECKDLIVQRLLDWALPTIRRRAVGGFPGWYKQRLAEAGTPANDNATTELHTLDSTG